jgi:hypothetical protein
MIGIRPNYTRGLKSRRRNEACSFKAINLALHHGVRELGTISDRSQVERIVGEEDRRENAPVSLRPWKACKR